MENEPTKPPSSHPFGTTMRIDIGPEVLEEARRGKNRVESRHPQAALKTPRIAVEPAPAGGADFQQLLQNIYDAGIITDASGSIVIANLRANQFFQAAPGQLLHGNVLNLIYGAEESLLPTVLNTVEENRFVLIQAYCVRLDGTFFPAEISVNRLRLAGKDHLSFFIRDVTLRKEQEERLRAGYLALQNSSSGIVITGPDAQIEYWNPAFLSLVGAAGPSDVEGHDLRQFLAEPDRADNLVAAIKEGQSWSGELQMKRLDSAGFYGQASITPNLNADGEQVGMVWSMYDATPQKIAQQQLEAYASELHAKNTQMQDDLNMASELHRALLPVGFNRFPAGAEASEALVRFHHLYHPSGTIGGDYFDIREISEHEVAVFISDVMGHGVRSALVVATLRGLIEQLRPLARDPGALMTQLNSAYATIFKQLAGDVTFSTALYAVLDTRTGMLRCASASHPPPYFLRRNAGVVEHLRVSPNGGSAALGLFDGTQYRSEEFPMEPGDLLLLYTDGLSEVEGADNEFFDNGCFEQTLRAELGRPADGLLKAVLASAREFSESGGFEDDVCLVAVELNRLAE